MGSNYLGTDQPNQTAVRSLAWPATRCFCGSGPIPRPPTFRLWTSAPMPSPAQETHLLQAGAQASLTKPIDVNELLDLVNAITAQRTRPVAAPASQT
jgi:CheY-like chemotaxis protein